MKLSIAEICWFTVSTPYGRNFVEGERVLHAGHVIFCGKEKLKTRSVKDKLHEIRGEISFQGVVKDVVCSKESSLYLVGGNSFFNNKTFVIFRLGCTFKTNRIIETYDYQKLILSK